MQLLKMRLMWWFGLGLLLAACQARANASGAIQAYLQAKVDKDVTRMIGLSCPAWEQQARIEAAAFQSMNARLDSVSCQDSRVEGDTTLVGCSGKIVTTYNGETREWSLSDHFFKAVFDDGEWRMCGYE